MNTQKVNRQYIIVTPCKNEGDNLPNLIQSIASQKLKPVLWVIVDDGSTDDAPAIIKKSQEDYSWIHSIQLDSNERDLGIHLASIVRNGFDFAVEYCKIKGFDYRFLGNVDADLTLEYTFFDNIIKEFEKDQKLGIASGGTNHIIGDKIIHAKLREDEPSGGHMLIRRECFEDCGGIPVTYAWDSVLKAKARLRGWAPKRFEGNIATEIRAVSSAEGYWSGYSHSGKEDYYLNYNPIHVWIKGIKYSFRKPWYGGIAYLVGYLNSIMRREQKIADTEVKDYFRNKWKSTYKQRLFRKRL